MTALSRFVGLFILILMVWGTMLLGGKIGIYLDIPSVVLVSGALLGGILLCFSPGQIADAIKAAWLGTNAPPASAKQQQTRAAVFGRLYLLAWGSGLVGTLIGVIAMLSDLSDPASIGKGLAVALLTSLYGAGLAELLFGPLQQTMLNLPTSDGEPAAALPQSPTNNPHQSALWKGAAVIAFIVGMMGAVVVSVPRESPTAEATTPQAEQTALLAEDAPEEG